MRVQCRAVGTLHCSTVQYSAVQYSELQCSAVQCSAGQCRALGPLQQLRPFYLPAAGKEPALQIQMALGFILLFII